MKILLIYGAVAISAIMVQSGVRVSEKIQQKLIYIALAAAVLILCIMISFQVSNWLISDCLIIIISVLAGFTIGNSISKTSSLIVFCITAGIVDFVSFTGGLSSKIIEDYSKGHNLILQNLCISIPVDGKIVPLLGIGDLFVLGIILRSLNKIGFVSWFVSLIPISGLLIALLLGLKFHGIYALPIIGGMTILFLIIEYFLRLPRHNQ
jgi:hypothetical protein